MTILRTAPLLASSPPTSLSSVELFAGAGGLALGCELEGFHAAATLEWNRWACDTMRQNRDAGHPLARNWKVFEGDVRDYNWEDLSRKIDVVSGGPPCQPFSTGGKALAADDPRDMFPATAEVLASLAPRSFIIENVRGLARPRFAEYFEYIQHRLAIPEDSARDGEDWTQHLTRLRAERVSRTYNGLRYRVTSALVDAANYGVPQRRHRVILVGFRDDLDIDWSLPTATHSSAALMVDQWHGTYFDRHEVAPVHRPQRPTESGLHKARESADAALLPWRTVRDAIHDLPEPGLMGSTDVLNHVLKPGARSYPGHTGSTYDQPSKALKAGGHGVPGGENMLRRQDGSIRYFSVRESARIQTFPDDYELHGAWGETMRQLGNAVPVDLARVVARSVHKALNEQNHSIWGTT
ncbi:DNA cytosine methyltransferase [Demequina lutea]|uniref:DNA (cytosine-5-)-methyltransferase n=1 Tax=Demequina lutea TaxID=431489 RepID=A0A7Y9Z9S7_9MICO|nr:DNA cytosine methyltransferase [Demequina lutea]NYI40865.1 DNA (cytosine-5)-methyltransferase 1 [Demequina lutea]